MIPFLDSFNSTHTESLSNKLCSVNILQDISFINNEMMYEIAQEKALQDNNPQD